MYFGRQFSDHRISKGDCPCDKCALRMPSKTCGVAHTQRTADPGENHRRPPPEATLEEHLAADKQRGIRTRTGLTYHTIPNLLGFSDYRYRAADFSKFVEHAPGTLCLEQYRQPSPGPDLPGLTPSRRTRVVMITGVVSPDRLGSSADCHKSKASTNAGLPAWIDQRISSGTRPRRRSSADGAAPFCQTDHLP